MRGSFTLLFCWLIAGYSFVYGATVSGVNKTSAGKQIVIGVRLDPIVEQFVPLDTTRVDNNGFFEFEFELSQTMICRIPIGNIEAKLVVTPNADYKIKLPHFRAKTLAEELDPYFIHEEVPAVVLEGDKDYLNAHWWFYEAVFAHAYQEAILGTLPGGTGVAPWKMRADTLYANYENEAFQNLRKYRIYAFEALTNPLREEKAKMKRMDALPVGYDNNAYWELFNNNFSVVWPDTKSDINLLLQLAIVSGKILPLKEDLKSSVGLHNDSLMELVICKELYRVGVANPTVKKELANLLTNAADVFNSQQTREIAANLARILSVRIPGTPAPYVKFKEVSGLKLPTLLEGKYVYIAFGNTKLGKFKRQMPLLKAYQKMFRRDLLVLPVCIYQDSAEVAHFKEEYKIDLPLAYFEDGDGIKDKFGLEGIPKFYLIDRDGKIAQAPATSPEDKFEDLFNSILEKEKMERRGNGIFGW